MYNLNDEELLNERGYPAEFGGSVLTSRDRERGDRGEIERDRVRDVRERDRAHVNVGLSSNNRHLVNNSNNYDNDVDLMRSEREKEKDRYLQSNQPQLLQPQSSRRDRDDYSPHRGNNRRVLNAM